MHAHFFPVSDENSECQRRQSSIYTLRDFYTFMRLMIDETMHVLIVPCFERTDVNPSPMRIEHADNDRENRTNKKKNVIPQNTPKFQQQPTQSPCTFFPVLLSLMFPLTAPFLITTFPLPTTASPLPTTQLNLQQVRQERIPSCQIFRTHGVAICWW